MEPVVAAWFGGSFSPPTVAHIDVINAVGSKLREIRGPCTVYVVPVSQKYPKASIQCVNLETRLALMAAFIEDIRDKARAGGIGEEVQFELMDYEMKDEREGGVPTVDSLTTLKELLSKDKPVDLYLAQGQDNMLAILQGKWKKTDVLLEYPMMIFPRGAGDDYRETLKAGVDEYVAKNPGKVINPLSYTKIDTLTPVTAVSAEFRDETSSSEVRKLFREGRDEEASALLSPRVADVLRKANPYRSLACEPAAAAAKGGRRTRGRRSSKTKAKKSRRRQRGYKH